MSRCADCGSFAINHHLHGRDGTQEDTCDVCYWRNAANALEKECERLRAAGEAQHARDSAELRSQCAARDQYRGLSIKYGDKLSEVFKLLARCQEKLDPNRDTVLRGEVCDAFKAKPCAPTK